MKYTKRPGGYSADVSTLPAPDLLMVVPAFNERDRLTELVMAVFAAANARRHGLEAYR